MKINMTKREFAGSFAKNTGFFLAGFLGMIGLINVFVWLFGKTVAIWLAWIVLAVGWIGFLSLTPEKTMTDAEREAIKAYMNKK